MSLHLGTVAPTGFTDFQSPQWLEVMQSLGCTTAQAYRNRIGWNGCHKSPVSTKQILDYIASSSLKYDSLHGIYGDDVDPSSEDESIRLKAVEAFKKEGQLALAIGGPLVIVHCSGIFKQQPDTRQKERRWDQLAKSVAELAEYGQSCGIHYAFENLPPYHYISSDIGRLVSLLAPYPIEYIGLCFDVAHANIGGDPVQAAMIAGDRITYVHACDNDGQTDSHRMLFEGNIDWMAFAGALRSIGYQNTVMLETFYTTDELILLAESGIKDRLDAFMQAAC